MWAYKNVRKAVGITSRNPHFALTLKHYLLTQYTVGFHTGGKMQLHVTKVGVIILPVFIPLSQERGLFNLSSRKLRIF